jgi:hypothetical protein
VCLQREQRNAAALPFNTSSDALYVVRHFGH